MWIQRVSDSKSPDFGCDKVSKSAPVYASQVIDLQFFLAFADSDRALVWLAAITSVMLLVSSNIGGSGYFNP
jgi:hypothetical protein